MKYLVDTNVWLERLLDQERAEDVKSFLENIDTNLITISDFSLHSIGVIMSKLKKDNDYISFVEDLIINGGLKPLRLDPL